MAKVVVIFHCQRLVLNWLPEEGSLVELGMADLEEHAISHLLSFVCFSQAFAFFHPSTWKQLIGICHSTSPKQRD